MSRVLSPAGAELRENLLTREAYRRLLELIVSEPDEQRQRLRCAQLVDSGASGLPPAHVVTLRAYARCLCSIAAVLARAKISEAHEAEMAGAAAMEAAEQLSPGEAETLALTQVSASVVGSFICPISCNQGKQSAPGLRGPPRSAPTALKRGAAADVMDAAKRGGDGKDEDGEGGAGGRASPYSQSTPSVRVFCMLRDGAVEGGGSGRPLQLRDGEENSAAVVRVQTMLIASLGRRSPSQEGPGQTARSAEEWEDDV